MGLHEKSLILEADILLPVVVRARGTALRSQICLTGVLVDPNIFGAHHVPVRWGFSGVQRALAFDRGGISLGEGGDWEEGLRRAVE